MYISFLRALSAAIITNSHYTRIYPTDLIANGGLLGDVIFFAVSGFCLANIRLPFGRWYIKRICRIYPAVIIITAIYMLIGLYPFKNDGITEIMYWFIYPTNYHFVASIVFLYIPYYFVKRYVIKDDINSGKKTLLCFVIVSAVHILAYIFVYDKSYYHVDNVREPFIRFLFFEAMLLGVYFRINHNKFIDKNTSWNWGWMFLIFVVYFISKTLFSQRMQISQFQLLNQAVLLLLLYFVFKSFAGIDDKIRKIPAKLYKIIKYVADITLEIYVVQNALIPIFRDVASFPINWIITTLSILCIAAVLHYMVKLIDRIIEPLYNK